MTFGTVKTLTGIRKYFAILTNQNNQFPKQLELDDKYALEIVLDIIATVLR